MVIVDTELKRRAAVGQPVLIGMAGAGFMGRGIARQLGRHMAGLRLAAVYSRNPEQGQSACLEAGISDVRVVSSSSELSLTIAQGGAP